MKFDVKRCLPQNRIARWALLGALIGAVTFLLIYGTSTIRFSDDRWIYTPCDDMDIVQHYCGWLNYRQSDWSFPLANAINMGYPYPGGTCITYTDSIPLVAIFFKPFRALLPRVFQYFGPYQMLCYVLQGMAAAMLLARSLENDVQVAAGTGFFMIAPILMDRAYRHCALASHYLILFALYFYLSRRHTGKMPWQLPLLAALSVGIHPYFLGMIMAILLAFCLDHITYNGKTQAVWKRTAEAVCFFAAGVAAAMASGYCIGALGNHYVLQRGGYGDVSLNLNALFNPYSGFAYTWSRFLPVRPQYGYQYDSFNYAGFGILVLLAADAVLLAVQLWRQPEQKKAAGSFWARNIWLFCACLGLTVFAVTNKPWFDDHFFGEIHVPMKLIYFARIFRSSGRMFYPVYYLLYLGGIILFCRCVQTLVPGVKGRTAATALLAVVLLVQVYDLSGAIWGKHLNARKGSAAYDALPKELLALDGYQYMGGNGERMELLIAGQNGLKTPFSAANSSKDNGEEWDDIRNAFNNELMSMMGREPSERTCVYVTTNKDTWLSWQEQYEGQADFYHWYCEGLVDDYFMVPYQEELS